MKRRIIILTLLLLIIFILIYFKVVSIRNEKEKITKYNYEYEKYTNGVVYGTDVATVINKAIDNNEKNKIAKDKKGFYVNDNENYIEVELNIITNDTTYKMETIAKSGIVNFIANFNLITFKCTDIKYHSNGRISNLVFTQIEDY